jgi:hypothetical protein
MQTTVETGKSGKSGMSRSDRNDGIQLDKTQKQVTMTQQQTEAQALSRQPKPFISTVTTASLHSILTITITINHQTSIINIINFSSIQHPSSSPVIGAVGGNTGET